MNHMLTLKVLWQFNQNTIPLTIYFKMKKYFFLLICLYTSFAFSQESNDKKVFLDSLWNETTEGNHEFYRIIKDYNLDKGEYKVYNYYTSGVLQMEGSYKEKELKTETGNFIWYYKNGNKETQLTYVDSEPTGLETGWFENGNKKQIGEHTGLAWETGQNYKLLQVWNENKKQIVINGNGLLDSANKTGSLFVRIKDGFYDGVLKEKDFKSNTSRLETYKNGKFISGAFTDADKITHKYIEKEIQPIPKKGIEDFRNYFGRNIQIPIKAQSITGRIIIEFIIEKDGKIVEPKIVQSLDPELDAEVIRVLTQYEDWIPGEQRGQSIRARYTLPLSFKASE